MSFVRPRRGTPQVRGMRGLTGAQTFLRKFAEKHNPRWTQASYGKKGGARATSVREHGGYGYILRVTGGNTAMPAGNRIEGRNEITEYPGSRRKTGPANLAVREKDRQRPARCKGKKTGDLILAARGKKPRLRRGHRARRARKPSRLLVVIIKKKLRTNRSFTGDACNERRRNEPGSRSCG